MSFLLDTDICSAHFKGNRDVTSRLMQYTGRLDVSVVTVGELYTWALRSAAPPSRGEKLQDFLADVRILDVDMKVARVFGRLRAGLLDRGRPVAPLDLLIAATALIHDLTVVTHNVHDFTGIEGLQVEDWLSR